MPGAVVMWQDRAACAGQPGRLFFSARDEDEARAKAICARCPVVAECLAHALATHEEFGILGGHTPTERRRLRTGKKKRGRVPQPIQHGSAYGYRAHRSRGEDPCTECRAAYAFARLRGDAKATA